MRTRFFLAQNRNAYNDQYTNNPKKVFIPLNLNRAQSRTTRRFDGDFNGGQRANGDERPNHSIEIGSWLKGNLLADPNFITNLTNILGVGEDAIESCADVTACLPVITGTGQTTVTGDWTSGWVVDTPVVTPPVVTPPPTLTAGDGIILDTTTNPDGSTNYEISVDCSYCASIVPPLCCDINITGPLVLADYNQFRKTGPTKYEQEWFLNGNLVGTVIIETTQMVNPAGYPDDIIGTSLEFATDIQIIPAPNNPISDCTVEIAVPVILDADVGNSYIDFENPIKVLGYGSYSGTGQVPTSYDVLANNPNRLYVGASSGGLNFDPYTILGPLNTPIKITGWHGTNSNGDSDWVGFGFALTTQGAPC